MKSALWAVLAAGLLAANTGCSCCYALFHHGSQCDDGGGNCDQCGGSGCGHGDCGQGCANGGSGGSHCGPGGCAAKGHHGAKQAYEDIPDSDAGPEGPPTGAVAYPYYTTRGPRDFLAKQPSSIGP